MANLKDAVLKIIEEQKKTLEKLRDELDEINIEYNKIENMQTTIEWLKGEMSKLYSEFNKDNVSGFISKQEDLLEQAKVIEKGRLFHSFYAGGGVYDDEDFHEQFEQYYKELYGTKHQDK